jgi:hypothetical protein
MRMVDAPSLESLVQEIKDVRRQRNDTAIIIPTIDSKKLVSALEALSNQDCKDFDIVTVYGNTDNFITAPWANMINIRTKENLGSAGAFYTGEKLALKEEYQNIILADDDCIPLNKDLIGKIKNALKKHDVVLPKEIHDGRIEKSELIHHYGAMKAGVYRVVGHNYLPLFVGAVDTEFVYRLKKRYMIKRIGSAVYHSENKPFFICKADSNQRYYSKNDIIKNFLHDDILLAFRYIMVHILVGVIFFPIKPGILYHCLEEAVIASSMDMKKRAKNWFDPFEASEYYAHDYKVSGFLDFKSIDKKVLVSRDNMYLTSVLFARSVGFVNKEKYHVICQDRSKLSMLFGWVVFLFSIPPAMMISAILTVRGLMLRKKKNLNPYKYGV